MTQVTEHFSFDELKCKCGCGRMAIQDTDFLEKLEDLRVMYGKPIHILSGYRCPEHNNRVSTTGYSGPHTIGAVDIRISGANAHKILCLAMLVGFTGVGIKQHGDMAGRFIHLDNLTTHDHLRPRIWSY